MRTRRHAWMTGLMVLMMVPLSGTVLRAAETGKLRVYVWPGESEIFIDGQHMGDASSDGTLAISQIGAGQHLVGIYNYGFIPQRYTVTIEAGKVTGLHVRLQPMGGTQTGPWGRIRIKGAPRAAVLLNGKTPEYVVGHGDEFDQEFGTGHEELLVHPGTYEVTLVHGAQTIWSGRVLVEADQQVVVNAKSGEQRTEKWSGPGGSRPMFTAGLRSARVVVAPVTGEFRAEPGSIDCAGSSKLNWSSTGAVEGEISEVGKVGPSGEQTVSPKQTTTYTFKALGPGGEATSSATVNVASTVQASLEVTPPEIRYKRLADKVMEQGSATLNWSTSGAAEVTLEPFGSVNSSGSRVVQAEPKQRKTGPVDETLTYTLKAVNACGAEETRTATLHLTGSVVAVSEAAVTESASEVGLVLGSVFFPTDYPEASRPEAGLVKSQQGVLGRLAGAFKKYLEFDPNARLEVEAHADPRGSAQHNQTLTERRAARAKEYLVSQGVAASAVGTKAYGKQQELSREEVKQLEAKNPNPPPKARARAAWEDWLAYNRRVDISLQPAGLHSSQYYPHNAADSGVLWQAPKPRWRVVEKAQ